MYILFPLAVWRTVTTEPDRRQVGEPFNKGPHLSAFAAEERVQEHFARGSEVFEHDLDRLVEHALLLHLLEQPARCRERGLGGALPLARKASLTSCHMQHDLLTRSDLINELRLINGQAVFLRGGWAVLEGLVDTPAQRVHGVIFREAAVQDERRHGRLLGSMRKERAVRQRARRRLLEHAEISL